MVGSCGWDPDVIGDVGELDPVTPSEVRELREFDRQRQFLG
jgi:hypothetical protein